MKARALALISTAVAAALVGCADLFGPQARGGTIETTNGLTARVVLPTGKPAARIKVYLLDGQDWLEKTKDGESIVLATAETNDSGKFEFRILKTDSSRSVNLYADVEGYAFLIPRASQRSLLANYNNVIGMSKKVTYVGNIRETEARAQKVFLTGSPFSAAVDPTGRFEFTNIPQGGYSVVIQRRLPDQSLEYVAADNVELNEKQVGRPDTLVTVPEKSFLLEDFEDNDINNRISNIFPQGLWNYYGDNDFGGSSIMHQPANLAPENWPKALEDGQPNNQALHVQYTATGNLPRPVYMDSKAGSDAAYVSLMVDIGQTRKHYNLSGMDSLTFRTAGDGQMIVELIQQNPGDVSLQVVASQTCDLGTWASCSIKPSDLTVHIGWFPSDPKAFHSDLIAAGLPAYEEKPKTWGDMGGKITMISFKAVRGTEFWLDDIRIHGINVGDIIK